MSPRILDEDSLKAREQELIETALSIMESDGAAGLTMDKVVARVPYSKGTVYNLFSSKEDLLIGVCNAGMEILAELFQRAGGFKGSSRERILALVYAYLLHALLHSTHFMLVVSAKTPNLIERTSPKRLAEHLELEQVLLGFMLELVKAGITDGDVKVPAHMTKEQLVFSIWATGFGTIALLACHEGHCGSRSSLNLEVEVFNSVNLILDGMGWQPLFKQMDDGKIRQRIANEVFSEEFAQLKLLQPNE